MQFVFDDDIAQILIREGIVPGASKATRSVGVSIGDDPHIYERTFSPSRKQTEIKISLTQLSGKDGRGALTTLYDWFVPDPSIRPDPVSVLGVLHRSPGGSVPQWNLVIQEPVDLDQSSPPVLIRRTREPSQARSDWLHRREILARDLETSGRLAEERALEIATTLYPRPRHRCFWRENYLDAEKIQVRQLSILADIDVWDEAQSSVAALIEVKAQKITSHRVAPQFYLSKGEYRSYLDSRKQHLAYQIWLFQYKNIDELKTAAEAPRPLVFDRVPKTSLHPETFRVTLGLHSGRRI